MNNIIHLDSSIMGDNSVSRQLTAQVVKHINQGQKATTYIDLAQQELPTLDGFTVGSFLPKKSIVPANNKPLPPHQTSLFRNLKQPTLSYSVRLCTTSPFQRS